MNAPASVADAKRVLRRQARRIRAAISAAHRQAAAAALADTGLAFLSLPWRPIVSGYHPLAEELDPLPLMQRLADGGIATALPAHPPGAPDLSFHLWRPGEPLVRGDYGVMMPPLNARRVEPDVLLVPLLAFDAAGNRLGYGAGYFDRAIARLRALKLVTVIGIGFDEQEVADVPHEPWDQPLDWLLTPSGPRRC